MCGKEALNQSTRPACERKLVLRVSGVSCDAADALLPGLEEERDLRLAEAVDGLHRVADQEQRAAVILLPARGQSFDQFELRVRGVLELVDQDVLDARVEREQEVGRLLRRAERAHRGLRHLGEVGLAVLGEHQLQVRGGARQELEDRAERLPLLVGVALLGHAQERFERLAQRLGLLRGRDRVAAHAPGVVLGERGVGELDRGLRMQRARVGEDAGAFGLQVALQLVAGGR